ncbi:hypothetical protein [Runella defluvii]|uniref:hypothetical protein n=1 Tax=Runella defluvii TaxID=370973 RepID=UPI001C85D848
MLRSELTKDWFGSYVSEYNFAQSIEDGATVAHLLQKECAACGANQPRIGSGGRRDDRLEEIAKHIVQHFPYRLDVDDDEGNSKPIKGLGCLCRRDQRKTPKNGG